jgi:hypothetical protein
MGYLYSFLKPSHAYYENWQELCRRRKLIWIRTALMLPATMLLCILMLPLCFLLGTEVPLFIVPLAVMAAPVALRVRQSSWPCPRCKQPFFGDWGMYHSMAIRCLHCGLELYAPCDPAQQQWEFESHVSPSAAKAVE